MACPPEYSGRPASETIAGHAFVPFEMELDRKIAESGTERIAHRIRFETNWRAHKYFDFFAGGAYTFAGQNAPREMDLHGGMKIRF